MSERAGEKEDSGDAIQKVTRDCTCTCACIYYILYICYKFQIISHVYTHIYIYYMDELVRVVGRCGGACSWWYGCVACAGCRV